ncbi:hypothetical protein ACFLTH_04590 [Bacteroidota bacterium]
MKKKKILLIGGSLNQTTMMHHISKHLNDYDCYFSPYYTDGILDKFVQRGLLGFTILGGNFKNQTEEYFHDHNLKTDYKGLQNNYDLIFTCSDLMVQKNIIGKKIILVQEGMTDPEELPYYLTKYLKFPRWVTTANTGISNEYDLFCVASEGYKELFVHKGADPGKIRVTGIPNFDNVASYVNNNFPHKDFVLVATTDMRETFKYENRIKFIKHCVKLAAERKLIFKLHPNENFDKATAEINKFAPGALVYTEGNIHEMIAKCETLITRFSSVVFTGLALGKEIYSEFDLAELKHLLPIQNGGSSAKNIAKLGIDLLENSKNKSAA